MNNLTSLLARASLAGVALFAFANLAQAGQCPADQVMEGAVTSGMTEPKGVEDTVLSAIDLAPKGDAFEGHSLRLRRLVIQPGGVVPWHDHATRPANIYVVSGTIEEYASNCKVAIVHKAGEAVAEFGATLAHWWKNSGSEPVVLISADLFHDGKMDDEMM